MCTKVNMFSPRKAGTRFGVQTSEKSGRPKESNALLKCVLKWTFFNPRKAGTGFGVQKPETCSLFKREQFLIKACTKVKIVSPGKAGAGFGVQKSESFTPPWNWLPGQDYPWNWLGLAAWKNHYWTNSAPIPFNVDWDRKHGDFCKFVPEALFTTSPRRAQKRAHPPPKPLFH